MHGAAAPRKTNIFMKPQNKKSQQNHKPNTYRATAPYQHRRKD
jgi:hypothetical protein